MPDSGRVKRQDDVLARDPRRHQLLRDRPIRPIVLDPDLPIDDVDDG